jgi:hypothetical protein
MAWSRDCFKPFCFGLFRWLSGSQGHLQYLLVLVEDEKVDRFHTSPIRYFLAVLGRREFRYLTFAVGI